MASRNRNKGRSRKGVKSNIRIKLGVSVEEYNRFRNAVRALQLRRGRELKRIGADKLTELEKTAGINIVTPYVSSNLSKFRSKKQFREYAEYVYETQRRRDYQKWRVGRFREGYIKAIEGSISDVELKAQAVKKLESMDIYQFSSVAARGGLASFFFWYDENVEEGDKELELQFIINDM